MGRNFTLTLALALAGCQGAHEPLWQTGSSTMAAGADGTIYVADADNGELLRVSGADGSLEKLLLGAEPYRMVRVGDLIYITLRGERRVVVVEDGPEGLRVVATWEVGAEPSGIAVSPDGKVIYVALSTEGVVVALDRDTGEEIGRFEVPGQPRWIAVHPSGDRIYVGSAMGGAYVIEVETGRVRELDLPKVPRGDEFTGEVHDMVPRVTGDPVVTPEGDALVVPGLYVDNETSVGPADPTEPTVDRPSEITEGGYASGTADGLTRFNPAVITIGLDPEGKPTSQRAAQLVSGRSGLANAGGFNGDLGFDMAFEEVSFEDSGASDGARREAGDQGFGSRVRGYLSSLSVSRDGHVVYATVEGAGAMAVVPTWPVVAGRPSRGDGLEDPFFGISTFDPTASMVLAAPMGARGAVIDDAGKVHVWGFLDREIATLSSDTVEGAMGSLVANFFVEEMPGLLGVTGVGPSVLPPEVQAGRRLFFSNNNPSMAVEGAGVSCATCHFEGRNDGLTWTFDHGPRNTPSLAGLVSATAPVTWTNDVPTVADEAAITSRGRMGGHGVSGAELRAIAAFIDWTPDADVPLRGSSDPAVARGAAIFARADTACATCHTGARGTDNRGHDMVGERGVNTPALIGVAASAPYFHDGSAATLADVLLRADEVGMGRTAHLSAAELADLEAYLRSL